jgi:hypothetical protein
LVILTGIILVALPFINRFYQKRADKFADNLLKDNPPEYKKQVKGNAYRYLIGYWIWAILSGFLEIIQHLESIGNSFDIQNNLPYDFVIAVYIWCLELQKRIEKNVGR